METLKNTDIKTAFNELLKLLNIPKKQAGYQLVDKDLAAVCDHYNLNLLVIIKSINENKNPNYLCYKKYKLPTVAIYHENNNYWRPGNFNKNYTLPKISQHNIIFITGTPSLITRIIDISKYFQHDSDNLKINNQQPGIKNKIKTYSDSNTITSVINVSQMADSHTPATNAEPELKSSEIYFNEIKIKNVNVDINPTLKFKIYYCYKI